MTTALYRRSSREVLKISLKNQTFADADLTYFGVVTNPSLPDGTDVREQLPDGTLGPLRQVGVAKILDVDGVTIRNATASEIATFSAAEADDESQQDADRAKTLLKSHPQWRKVLGLLFKAINQTRQDAGLTPWTKAQIVSFIDGNVLKGD